ncbi:putative Spectrin beta chain [Daphnia magna]|uniref:Putative Spectrin beta chain n=1 Tax=Daphnia magna TaxID=35525 RepID=A0A162T907_9CRUS|nr:putative Spectrin beta chain [Daphnia magna]
MTTDISVSVRWDPATQQEIIDDYDYDGGNSSSRLFERSRIKALAGKFFLFFFLPQLLFFESRDPHFVTLSINPQQTE